ncbi:MAG: SUMF1/EgtB/PvdO family nonheme iron enzyme [Planctomycetes bacterium]|nr:SUMF1/EgtB/PvdO family nonheme iron enzyme [Planctomycetota bacterium]
MPPRPQSHHSGDQIAGRYDLREELGRGGMGVVFRAFDPELGREVALKLYRGPLTESDALERFEREGRIAARLRHPHIVPVHDFGLFEGRPYLSFALIEGARSADQCFEELSVAQRVALVRDAATALGYAHALGVIHRDVKPENLLVDPSGHVWVTDFGVARASGESRLTRTGQFVGTPTHMAPEQYAGSAGEIGPPADVWALGVVLYQSLCGRLPFEANNLLALVSLVATTTPPKPSELDSQAPRALDEVCLSALDQDPTRRPRDGAALALELDRYLAGELAPDRSPVLRTGAFLTLIAIGLAVWAATLSRGEPSLPPGPSSPRSEVAPPSPGPPTPQWWTLTPADRRPPLPLPEGVTRAARSFVLTRRGLKIPLVWVPPGTFRMGSDRDVSERPVHSVQITRGFFLGKFEVRVSDYERFCEATGRGPPSRPYFDQEQTHPVVGVSWEDAASFCTWLDARLPTEAEWEWSARGPKSLLYPWGNQLAGPRHANLRGHEDRFRTTSPVGSFPKGASWIGAFDLAGSVWEWVQDHDHVFVASDQIDPTGPREGALRIRKGGSYSSQARNLTATNRNPTAPGKIQFDLGFRIAFGS